MLLAKNRWVHYEHRDKDPKESQCGGSKNVRATSDEGALNQNAVDDFAAFMLVGIEGSFGGILDKFTENRVSNKQAAPPTQEVCSFLVCSRVESLS